MSGKTKERRAGSVEQRVQLGDNDGYYHPPKLTLPAKVNGPARPGGPHFTLCWLFFAFFCDTIVLY